MNTLTISYTWEDSTSNIVRRNIEKGNWMTSTARISIAINGKIVQVPFNNPKGDLQYTNTNWIGDLLESTAPAILTVNDEYSYVTWPDDPLCWAFRRQGKLIWFKFALAGEPKRIIAETSVPEKEVIKTMFSLYDRFVKEILAINPRLAEHERFKPIIEARDALSKRLKELKQTRARDE